MCLQIFAFSYLIRMILINEQRNDSDSESGRTIETCFAANEKMKEV